MLNTFRNKNKKAGFTLIELLAVLVILGIIIGISLPLIRRIQDENKKKKFETYSDSVKYSAKLYMNSYEEDLFGDSKSGCYILRYKEMKERNLLKDIDVDNVSCESDFTYVRVVKVNERYAYTPSLFCINKSTNKEEYSTKTSQMMTCPDNGMATITIDPPGAEKYVKGLNNIQVFVSSPMGFYPYDVSLEYAFSTTKNEANIMGSWSPLKFNVPSEDEQMEMIDNGDVVITSNSLSTPAGYNGDVYLLVRIIHLEDLARSDWSSLEGKIEKSDAYWLDNTKPTGEIKVATVSAPKGERNVTVELKDNFKLNEYYYKTTYPSGNVTYTKINNAGGQHSFNTTVKENGVGTYYLKVLDSAGNESNVVSKTFYRTTFNTVEGTLKNGFVSKVVSIENEPFALPDAEKAGNTFEGWYDSLTGGNLVGKAGASYTPTATKTLYARWTLNKYTLTYNSNGGSNCSPISITKNYNETWGTLCSPTRTGYDFKEWNTKADGTGDVIKSNSKVTSNLTVYAQWTIKSYTLTYNSNGGSNCSPTSITKKYNETWGTLCSPTRTGYDFKGWNTKKDGSGTPITASSKATSNLTVYAQWTIKTYTLTYNSNGGSNCSPNSVTKNYNEAWGTLCSPSRTGYDFKGWNTKADGSGTPITASSKATSSLTVYAQWAIKSYTLTYNSNGGSNCSPNSITKKYNEAWGTLCSSSRTNYQFMGWNTKADGSGTPITASSKATSSLTVYAQWKVKILDKCSVVKDSSLLSECASFQNDSWATIASNVRNGNANRYPVGCTRSVNSNTVRVANNTTPSECSSYGFSQTACGFVLEFTNIIATFKMNNDATAAGGWPSSALRSYVNGDLYNRLPSDLQNVIINTYVVSGATYGTIASTDKLYLLTTRELYSVGWTAQASSVDNLTATRQLDYYSCSNVRGSMSEYETPDPNLPVLLKDGGCGDECNYWWLRSANGANDKQFWRVTNYYNGIYNSQGHGSVTSASRVCGVSPAFRIG